MHSSIPVCERCNEPNAYFGIAYGPPDPYSKDSHRPLLLASRETQRQVRRLLTESFLSTGNPKRLPNPEFLDTDLQPRYCIFTILHIYGLF